MIHNSVEEVMAAIAMIAVVSAAIVLRSHRYVTADGNNSYSAEFADMQAKHIKVAKQLGFQTAPLKNNDAVNDVVGLIKVGSCKYFKVSEMKHGAPYLTPVANDGLRRIAKEFYDDCAAKNLPTARLIVTSMLRTEEDVKGLQKHNSNAVSDSPHMYGTTFDISWSYYQTPNRNADGNEYLSVLADVLRKQMKEGLILVRYEKQQRCFHITVCK